MMTKKRHCSATTKTGEPCRAAPLKDQNTCLAHADAKTRETAGFILGDNGKAGRKPNPRVIDVLRERYEARADQMIDVYLEAAKAVDQNGEPDHPVRLRAVEALADRVYGKPKQATEISGPEGGPIEHADNSIPDETSFHQKAAKLLAEAGAITASASQGE